ncbi:MAG: DMT family transporter [archaeon GBS-70-058]|nr:DMT family transporter [Candidatus Culexarchaeum nevadense]
MKDYIILGIAVFSVSWASIFVVLSNAPGIVCAFWRMTLSSILTLLIMVVSGEYKWIFKFNPLIVISGLSLAIHFTFWMESLRMIPVALSTTIVNLHPIFSSIIGKFMGERISGKRLTGIFTSIIGSTIMVTGVRGLNISEISFPGVIYALIGAASFSIYLSANKSLRKEMSTQALTTFVYGIGGIVTLTYILANNINFTSYTINTWIYITLLTIIPMLMGHTLLNYLLRSLGLITVATSTLGEPIISTILAYIVLGQTIDNIKILSMIVTLIGIYLAISQ